MLTFGIRHSLGDFLVPCGSLRNNSLASKAMMKDVGASGAAAERNFLFLHRFSLDEGCNLVSFPKEEK